MISKEIEGVKLRVNILVHSFFKVKQEEIEKEV